MTPGLGEVNTYIGHRDYCGFPSAGSISSYPVGIRFSDTTTEVQSSNLLQLPIGSPTTRR